MIQRKKPKKEKKRLSFKGVSKWFGSVEARCVLILLAGSMVLLAIYCAASAPERYSLKVGSISHTTITASKDVVDELTTEERRNAAANAVEPSYHLQVGASEEVMADLETIFAEMRTVQQYGLTLRQGDASGRNQTFAEEEVAYAKTLVSSITLSNYQIQTLLRASSEQFDEMVSTTTTAVQNTLNTTIREGQVNQSISTILQIAGYKVETSLFQNILPTVLRSCVKPNMVIEQESTELARQKAREAVEPVLYLQGQNIIREGERVGANQLAMLRALGLLEDNQYDLAIYGGAALMILAAMLLLVLMLLLLEPGVFHDVRKISVIMVVMCVTVGLCVVTVKVINAYLVPVTMGAMLLTGLLGGPVGVAGTLSLSLIVSSLTMGGSNSYSAEMIHLMITSLVGGIVSVRFLRNKPQRVRMVICGFVVALCNLVMMTAVGMLTSVNMTTVMYNALWCMGGGIFSGVLAVGLQPVFETVFNLATPSKLMELANPNQPLLRRLLIEAPGTYHHAIIVANLAEAAAEKIGANPLLARAGAYFHDIGKLKRPLYFKENQMGENPHDHTDPYVSSAILTSHTRDGQQLAQKYRLPPEIQQIIVEHHGDTPVMFFYHKALQQAAGCPVDISDFRYEGPRPSMKESAIIMLADTIEAAVRAMPDPTPQAIERHIERLVRGKIEDGQLSNSPLSLRDIDGIAEAFSTVLNGVFHERIEYPTVDMSPRAVAPVTPAQPAVESVPAAKPAQPVAEPVPAAKPVQPAAEPTPATKPAPVTEPAAPAQAVAGNAPAEPEAAPVQEETPAETVALTETADKPEKGENA